jgi:hypothetical protein
MSQPIQYQHACHNQHSNNTHVTTNTVSTFNTVSAFNTVSTSNTVSTANVLVVPFPMDDGYLQLGTTVLNWYRKNNAYHSSAIKKTITMAVTHSLKCSLARPSPAFAHQNIHSPTNLRGVRSPVRHRYSLVEVFARPSVSVVRSSKHSLACPSPAFTR